MAILRIVRRVHRHCISKNCMVKLIAVHAAVAQACVVQSHVPCVCCRQKKLIA
jgi:hypothetical protein